MGWPVRARRDVRQQQFVDAVELVSLTQGLGDAGGPAPTGRAHDEILRPADRDQSYRGSDGLLSIWPGRRGHCYARKRAV